MITILEETTKNPITLMGARAGVCWGADTADNEKNYNRGLDCIKSGHGRVMEYVNVEMIIDGYSARVIREWYTHIGGAPTRLQASTRYINYKTFDIVVPPSVAKAGKEAEAAVSETIAKIKDTLKLLEEAGVPREDSAMLLPLGMTTKIVDKRNLRSLVDMSHQRMCSRAFWEYRKLFAELSKALADYSDEWKTLVDMLFMPKCELSGFCTEKKSCGRMPKKQK
ncbi:MAG: FAD-dependent thymidylate synthase [Spirochaetaceae bacterium]|nr:FAD-dependent thymidylate synthase [Spirochaetaceae bacterium]